MAEGFIGGVADILTSVVTELIDRPMRTFSFGDIKFFKQWYDDQDYHQKLKIKELVHNGQLELVNGGWMPPDEALTQYDSIIDNFMVG